MITVTLQAVQHKYTAVHATSGSDLSVEFESEHISLELPSHGITFESGWKILPLFNPLVRKFIVGHQNVNCG